MITRAALLGTAIAALGIGTAWAQATPADKPGPVALDNDYVRVSRDVAPCASAATPGCEDRVIVAIGKTTVTLGKTHRHLTKGQVAVFKKGDTYSVAGGPRAGES